MRRSAFNQRFLRVEHRGRTIAAAGTINQIADAVRRCRPPGYSIYDVLLDHLYGGRYDTRMWGRIIRHPNGVLSVEPNARPS
jgi:hypothetical protein